MFRTGRKTRASLQTVCAANPTLFGMARLHLGTAGKSSFSASGFSWSAFLDSTAPEAGDNAELRRIRRAVLGDLGPILQSRSGWLRHKRLLAILRAWYEQVPESEQSEAQATQRLRQAMLDVSPVDYQFGIRRTSAAEESGIGFGESARTVEPPGLFSASLGISH